MLRKICDSKYGIYHLTLRLKQGNSCRGNFLFIFCHMFLIHRNHDAYCDPHSQSITIYLLVLYCTSISQLKDNDIFSAVAA
jgi:hypothetical protein